MKNRLGLLIAGDVLVVVIVTVTGFATHNEAEIAMLPRMLATILPVAAGWFLAAPWLGLFTPAVVRQPRRLWRVVFAFVFAAPLAAVLRAVLLGGQVIPLFVLVLGATSALGMLLSLTKLRDTWRALWRVLWWALTRRAAG